MFGIRRLPVLFQNVVSPMRYIQRLRWYLGPVELRCGVTVVV